MLKRPDGDPAGASTVAPGAYTFTPEPVNQWPAASPSPYQVVWWDPHVLALDAASPLGLRRDDLIAKDVDPTVIAARLHAHSHWLAERAATVARASRPALTARATELAGRRTLPLLDTVDLSGIELVEVGRFRQRPSGPLFGSLVHATLVTVPLDGSETVVRCVAETQSRMLLGSGGGVDEEATAAADVVLAVLRHPLFDRVRASDALGRCWRELPIVWPAPDGLLVEGTIDLAFEDNGGLTVMDFKTGRELEADSERYRRQVAIYCLALGRLRRRDARGILMRI